MTGSKSLTEFDVATQKQITPNPNLLILIFY